MKKIYLLSIFFFLISSPCYSQPSISTVSPSTFSNGTSITISGNNFGTTGPNVVLFDDFEKGTNNNIISTSSGSAQIGNWTETEVSPYNPKYSSDYAHGGTKAMLSDQSNLDGAHWASVGFTPNTKVYVSFWVFLPSDKRVPGTGGPYGANWKLGDVNAGTVGDASSQYTVTVVLQDLPTDSIQAPCAWYGSSGLTDCDADGDGYAPSSWTKNRWQRIDAYYIGSTGTSGADYLWEVNSGTPWRNIWTQTNMHNLQTTDSSGWRLFRLHSYARQDSLGQCYYDDVYVATGTGALARVEIGNNATYSNCTNLAIITPTSWSNTSIEATVRTGSFSNGTAYLFVINSDGTASAGKEITIGSGGGGDTTAPTVSITTSDPSSITSDSFKVSGTANDAVWGTGSVCKWRIGSAPDASNGTTISGLTYSGTVDWSFTASGFSRGSNTLYVGCRDAVPNWGSKSMTVNYNPSSQGISGVSALTVR